MTTAIRTRLVKIGNSQGIRIPKPLLQQSGISADVEIEVQNGCLLLRAVSHPRAHWGEAFAAMAQHGGDALLDDDLATDWETDEWEW